MANILTNLKCLFLNDIKQCSKQIGSLFHTTAALDKSWNTRNTGARKFLEHNKTVFPPQAVGEEPRPAVSIIISKIVCSIPNISPYSMFVMQNKTLNTVHSKCGMLQVSFVECQ